MTKAVVLMSGGLDSSIVATQAVRELGKENVIGISFQYGQKHDKERFHAARVANFLKIDLSSVILSSAVFIGAKSALVGTKTAMPHQSYEELQAIEGPSPTYVPFRNGIFLSIAVARALIWEHDEVRIGVHAEDAHNWAYPDCSFEFTGAFAAAAYIGTYNKVRIVAPLQNMMKAEIVEMGYLIGAPFELTWSCYEGRQKACGKCPTCVERLAAFAACDYEDPLRYEDREFWKSRKRSI